MNYTELLIESEKDGLIVKDKTLKSADGRIKGKRIAIHKGLNETTKKCVLAEELGHYHTTVGDILDQSKTENRKQELRARVWAYNKLIGLSGIIKLHQNHIPAHEAAEYLDITEEFFYEALQYYKSKYGKCTTLDNYVIYFEPAIAVFELI